MLAASVYASEPYWRDQMCINIGMLAIGLVVALGFAAIIRMATGPRRPSSFSFKPRPYQYRSQEEYDADMEEMEEDDYWLYRRHQERLQEKRMKDQQHDKKF